MFELIAGIAMVCYGVWSGSEFASDSFQFSIRWALQTLVALVGGLYLCINSGVAFDFAGIYDLRPNLEKKNEKNINNSFPVETPDHIQTGTGDFICLSYLRDRLAKNGRADGIDLIAKLNGIFFEMNCPVAEKTNNNKDQ